MLRLNYKHSVSELIVPFANFTARQVAEETLNLVSFFCCILHVYWTILSLSHIDTLRKPKFGAVFRCSDLF